MLNVVVMVSGGGTNLQAILDAIAAGTVQNTRITAVISNNANAYGLERAAQAGIATAVVRVKDFDNREEFNTALLQKVQQYAPDLIVLAGFLVVIPPAFIKAYPGKIINVHPSLIPAFCGTGYYGLEVHKQALKRGVKITGATVHIVDEGTDTGPILLQKAVSVQADDTPESLQQRVMHEAEWQILPEAIHNIAMGEKM